MDIKRNTAGFSEHNDALHEAVIEAIEQSLMLLSKEMPYDKITVSAIVKKAGVSRSAFYRNYETKDDLLYGIIKKVTDKINKAILLNLNQREYWLGVIRIIYENRETIDFFAHSGKKISDYFFISEENKNHFIDQEGVWVMTFMRGGFLGLVEKWSEDNWKESPEEMLDLLFDTVKIIAKEYASK